VSRNTRAAPAPVRAAYPARPRPHRRRGDTDRTLGRRDAGARPAGRTGAAPGPRTIVGRARVGSICDFSSAAHHEAGRLGGADRGGPSRPYIVLGAVVSRAASSRSRAASSASVGTAERVIQSASREVGAERAGRVGRGARCNRRRSHSRIAANDPWRGMGVAALQRPGRLRQRAPWRGRDSDGSHAPPSFSRHHGLYLFLSSL